MSLVMLVVATILCFDLSGVDVVCRPPALDTELDEVLEKVRLRSMKRRVYVNNSSRYLFADGSVNVTLSGLSSYSLGQCSIVIDSLSFTASCRQRWKSNEHKYQQIS